MATNADQPLSFPADMIRVLRADGTLDPEHDPHLAVDDVVALYRAMMRTRFIDERLVMLQRQGRIGFHIGSLGEEATILGSAWAMRAGDFIFPCYREFGAALLRGMPLQRYLDNMFGNASDNAKGRQMPDHITARDARFGSVSSPIGTQITQAVGFAWAAKLRGDDVVTLVYFGEGSTSSNEFHNGMNFAGVYRVPAVLLCRNNGWAISVPSDQQTATATFAQKGVAYGVHSVRCDGNDLFAVVSATRAAVERAARGDGPTIVEAMTYRMSGHSTSDDPNAYRVDDALAPWRERDPIQRVRSYLIKAGAWDEGRDGELEGEFDREMKQAIAEAEKTPVPSIDSMFADVFESEPWHLREQHQAVVQGPRPQRQH
ncbi:MAG: thiamine pyrophosphate-dependent dehydrogenase E1 component subunit alpha [Deltaproteobacteria bacterium]|nr:thiamine pyrophosphate-dependent dehydrogenase E1 component subunit alpha [Deltaproteobacteria bacterium]